MKPTY